MIYHKGSLIPVWHEEVKKEVRTQHELTWDEYDSLMDELKWKDQTIEGLEAKMGLLQSMLRSARERTHELEGIVYD